MSDVADETNEVVTGESGGPERLLIGYPPTPQGEDALALGGLLASLLHAHPIVARVVPWPRYLLGDEPDLVVERETRGAFQVARDRLAGLEVETRAIVDPSVARALFGLIDEEEATLVVVGSTHRGRLGRLLPGSVATALLHGAPAAVAVAPLGYAGSQRRAIERVGVAVNGSAESFDALEAAIAIAVASGASLQLLSATDSNPYGYIAALEIMTAGEIESIATGKAREALRGAAANVPDEIVVESHLLRDEPGARLAEESRHLDLLVIGSRGYGSMGRTLLGSVSSFVMRKAACPVIVTPRGMAGDGLWQAGSRFARARARD